MVSAPDPAAQSGHVAASLFALMMASRIEQLPSVTSVSLVVVTVIVLATAGLAAGPASPATAVAATKRRRTCRNMDEDMRFPPPGFCHGMHGQPG